MANVSSFWAIGSNGDCEGANAFKCFAVGFYWVFHCVFMYGKVASVQMSPMGRSEFSSDSILVDGSTLCSMNGSQLPVSGVLHRLYSLLLCLLANRVQQENGLRRSSPPDLFDGCKVVSPRSGWLRTTDRWERTKRLA